MRSLRDCAIDVVEKGWTTIDEVLRVTQMFQMDQLKHCPAAWVFALCTGVGLGYNLPTLLDLSLSSLLSCVLSHPC